MQKLDIHCLTRSPHHHQSNGLAEKYVRIVKNLMTKPLENGQSIHMALLIYRKTPMSATIGSPVLLLFQRQLCTNLPMCNLAGRGQILRGDCPVSSCRNLNFRKQKKAYIMDNLSWYKTLKAKHGMKEL